jgi:hypothetical protein
MLLSMSTVRTLCASIALLVLWTYQAAAELPEHVQLATFGPIAADFPDEGPADLRFGRAVAARNGVAFIGIPGAPPNGHVAVLNQKPTGGWVRVDTLVLFNPFIDFQFGSVIAFRDGFAVIGGGSSVWVYKRINGNWRLWQRLFPPQGTLVNFPIDLQYEAGTLVISGYGSGTPSLVFIYELNSSQQFVLRQIVKPSDSKVDDSFGTSLSMTATEFVVGSPGGLGGRFQRFGLTHFDEPGAAYRFRRNTSGKWVQVQKLQPAVPAEGFGTSVAIDRGMILVGAPNVDKVGDETGGAVYGFLPGVGRYFESFKLQPRADEHGSYLDFGYKISMFGERIAVAAVEPYGREGIFPRGFVYTYTRDGSSLLPRGVVDSHFVASSIRVVNNVLLVGSPVERTCPSGCIGAAHLYNLNQFTQ